MRKEDKGVIIGQIADTVKQYGHFYLVDTTAMDAASTSDLRRKCFKAGIKLVVVKNSLLHKEFKDGVPTLKAAYAEEGFYVGADQLDALATIKSKNEVIADIVALLQSPAKNVISALQSGGNTIHGVLQTLGERAE